MDQATPERIKEVREMANVCTPMPQYKCHKNVWALKIANIETIRPTIAELEETLNSEEPKTDAYIPGLIITPAEPGYAPFIVSREYELKHNPQVGGYFVQYEDGYSSWSPAKAFESGYSRI